MIALLQLSEVYHAGSVPWIDGIRAFSEMGLCKGSEGMLGMDRQQERELRSVAEYQREDRVKSSRLMEADEGRNSCRCSHTASMRQPAMLQSIASIPRVSRRQHAGYVGQRTRQAGCPSRSKTWHVQANRGVGERHSYLQGIRERTSASSVRHTDNHLRYQKAQNMESHSLG